MESTSSSEENIKVFVRVRPPLSYDGVSEKGGTLCVDVSSVNSVVLHSQPESKVFTFDQVAGPDITQEDVFLSVGRPIIDSCMAGYNGTIFAYGQTGSGKTFTMLGPSNDTSGGIDTFSHELRGVIPRSLDYLFSLINREKQKYGELVEFLCKCSFLEIYNEQVHDLLDPASTGLHLRESIQRGVYVDGLLEQVVTTAADAYHVLIKGWTNRRVAATSMNRESSRSHAVFMLAVESKKRDTHQSVSKIRTSVLNLVDLAGSERQRDAQTVGIRLKEAGSINKSLSVLGNVIMALVDITHGKSRHVHYRDSKLTFLLRDSLGGNARTNLVANIHPLSKCFGETLSTLQFARRAKMIKNKAVVNEDTTGDMAQLQAEIKRLKDALTKLKVQGAGYLQLSVGSTQQQSEGDECEVYELSGANGTSQLREMLASSMSLRKEAEDEKKILQERMHQLDELCRRKDKSIQASKMILKLRDAHIASLEKKREDVAEITKDSVICSLQEEVVQLRTLLDHHPVVTRVAVENSNLKTQLHKLKISSGDGDKTIAHLKHYTLQLEKQLRPHLINQGGQCTEAILADTGMVDEVKRLTTLCRQLEQELRESQLSLSKQKQLHEGKIAAMEKHLTLAKNSNQDLERTIEQLQLRHNMERASLDSSHLRIIKAIVTPGSLRRHRQCHSTTSTPSRQQSVEDTTVVAQRLFFPPLTEIQNIPSTPASNSLTITPPSGEKVDKNEENDEEVIAKELLVEELKVLQESKTSLNRQLEEQHSVMLQCKSEKQSLEADVADLTHELEISKRSVVELEQAMKKNLEESKSQISQLNSAKLLLEDEVNDLRLCLQSADKELAELRAEVLKEKKAGSKRSSELFQQIADLEQKVSSKETEYENTLQELQTLQDELDTVREEAHFRQHYLEEKENQLEETKRTVASLEVDLERAEKQFAMEVEKGLTLASQLEEGSRKKLAAVLSENAQLTSELIQIRDELQGKLAAKQRDLDSALSSVQSLTRRADEDREALTSLMSSLQTARSVEMEQEAKITAMKQELKEREAQMMQNASQSENMAEQLHSAQRQLVKTASEHRKELCARDMQLEVLEDELHELTEQIQEMKSSYDEMKSQLQTNQAETELLKKKLVAKESQLNQLQAIQQHHRNDEFSDDAELTSFIERMECERANHSVVLQELQSVQEEKNRAVKSLQLQVAECDNYKRRCELMDTQLLAYKYKMEADHEEFSKSEAQYKEQLSIHAILLEEANKKSRVLQEERECCISEAEEAKASYEALKQSVSSMEDQLHRLRAQEEEMFKEKEVLRSQLEANLEEKARIAKECAKLVKENAMLSGHQNIRQKIHFHANLKLEYHKTLEVNKTLQAKLRQLEEKLQHGGLGGGSCCCGGGGGEKGD